MFKKNLILIIAAVAITVMPLIINNDAEYEGADDQAEEMVMEIHPDYQPWFTPLWEPPSGEIEGLLFSLQAALGSGFVCFFFGLYVGKKRTQQLEKTAFPEKADKSC